MDARQVIFTHASSSAALRCAVGDGTAGIEQNCTANGSKRSLKSAPPMKYWQIVADNLTKAAWSWGCSSESDLTGRVLFTADAYASDGRRFTVAASRHACR